MSTLTLAIVIVFIVGYLCIALESLTKVSKSAVALLMLVVCWTLFMIDPSAYLPDAVGENMPAVVSEVIEKNLGSTATTLFFLMGAMTIVELVDQNGGFNFVRNLLKTKSKRALLWRIAILTFFISAILDNMTTAIVMIMILRKLIDNREDRIKYAAMVIIAANSGGAFSPIGDVTTIMLWNKGLLSAVGVIKELFVPSILSVIIPTFFVSLSLKGNLAVESATAETEVSNSTGLSETQRKAIFWLGVGGLVFVPIFKSITHLPPFVGILLIVGILWTLTEIFYRNKGEESGTQKRISDILSRIDMGTILFFLGILMAVSCLETIGVLSQLGQGLNVTFNGNHYIVTGIIGVLSSIIDNVPLVAGCMGMYDTSMGADFVQDGIFWQLLSYCAGVGGSLLIIGSAAGVVVMGLEKITFGWYMKHITLIAFLGYIVGILVYWFEKSVIGL